MGSVSVKKALPMMLVLALVAGSASAVEVGEPGFGALTGQVSSTSSPLSFSKVYAYPLSGQPPRKAVTDDEGNFRFDRLQAGLYKVIAFKDGFVPAVALLSRSASAAYQFLNMELVEEEAERGDSEAGFWAVREKIPSDVLRDIEMSEAARQAVADAGPTSPLVDPYQVEARMQAVAGMHEDLELGSASVAGGRVGLQGTIANYAVGLSGELMALQSIPGASNTGDPTGRTQTLSLRVETPGSTGVQLSTLSNYVNRPASQSLRENHVGLERHRVSWSQPFGGRGRSDLSAEYISQSNVFHQAPIEPFGIPEESTSWRVDGTYSMTPTARSSVQTGFRYREREAIYDLRNRRRARNSLMFLPSQRVDLFGRGGVRLNPDVLVEFGIYSTLRDGSLSLAPSAGMVLHLAQNWQATASGSVQVHSEEANTLHSDFSAVLFSEYDVCRTTEEYCYEVSLARQTAEDQEISFGFVHRRFAETLHLYFNDDFFSRLESLYLVSGDRLPELRFAASRRLRPQILARLASSLASGGGGILYAADRTSYENQIRYLVTSLDTQFEQTSTGVFVAFHHLDQQLDPVKKKTKGRSPAMQKMELDRLQVMLTQDLDVLHALASDWAVQLNMELSRGSTPVSDALLDAEDLHKRVMGGLAVSF